ncbi:MAG: glycerate kinase, partial [Candidatus Hydrogenedentes bacterium]|nr:glycerate kinase [Candidatus Hydrogenedentota bacterium]
AEHVLLDEREGPALLVCVDDFEGYLAVGIAAMAKEFQVPVIAFTGVLGPGFEDLRRQGISEIIPINPDGLSPEESMKQVEELLADAAETFAKRWIASRSQGNTK